VAGGTYLFFYSPLSQSFVNHNLRHWSPSWRSIQQDITLSVLSAGVFALAAAFIMTGYSWGITRLYSHPQQYGLCYLGVSYGAVLVLQDAYFYFTHRLFHHPSLFRWLHQGHHRSRYPTPWTSFAFDPLEAIVQSLFLVGIVFVKYTVHYGLYFTFWDKLLGTQDPDYEQKFDERLTGKVDGI